MIAPPLRLQLFPQPSRTPPADPNVLSEIHPQSRSNPRSRGRSDYSSRSKSSSPDSDSDIDPDSSIYNSINSINKTRSSSIPRPPSSSRKRTESGTGSTAPRPLSPEYSHMMPLDRSLSTATTSTSATIAIAFGGSQYAGSMIGAPQSPNFAQQMMDPLQANDCVVQEPGPRRQPKQYSQSNHRDPLQPMNGNPNQPTSNPSHKKTVSTARKGSIPRLTSTSRLALLNAKEEQIKQQMEERRRLREEQQLQEELEQLKAQYSMPEALQPQQDPYRSVTPLSQDMSRPGTTGTGIGIGISSPDNSRELAPLEEQVIIAPTTGPSAELAASPMPIQSIFPRFDPQMHLNSMPDSVAAAAPSPAPTPAPISISTVPAAYHSSALRHGPAAAPLMAAPSINIPSAVGPVGGAHHVRSSTSKSIQPTAPGYVLPVDTLSQPSPCGDNDLKVMWDVSNGMHIDDAGLLLQTASAVFSIPMLPTLEPEPEPIKGMVRALPILFGPEIGQKPFYSVRQAAFPVTDDPVKPHEREHELIVFRHHPSADTDALPIAHVGLVPPPPPDSSTTRSAGTPMTVPTTPIGTAGAKAHICSITPVLANLQALDTIAATPLGQRLAVSDPHAQSPEAQQLAQTVLAQTAQREAVHVYWSKTGPTTGDYEVHHPAFDGKKLAVLVSGDFSRSPFGALGQIDRRHQTQQTQASQYRFGLHDREVAVSIWAPEEMYSQYEHNYADGVSGDEAGAMDPLDPRSQARQSSVPALKLDTSTPTIHGRGHFSFSSTAAHRSSRAPQSATALATPSVSARLVPGLIQAHATQAPGMAATHRPLLSFNATTGNLYLYPKSLLPLTIRSRFIFDLVTSIAYVVAAAEGRRAPDQGLLFAPPPKLGRTLASASSSHTSVESVFSNRGRESADSAATEEDAEDNGGKSILKSIKSRFSRRTLRTDDVELGTMQYHPNPYGRSGSSSRVQLNPSNQPFSAPPTNPQTPFSAHSQANSTWPHSFVEAQDPSRWTTPFSEAVDGITGDLGFQTRRKKQHDLQLKHDQMLAEMQNGQSKNSKRAKRKVEKQAKEVSEAKHSWPTRMIVGTVVFGFRVVVWFLKMLFKLASAVFKVLSGKGDK